jgi:hypothetical protein
VTIGLGHPFSQRKLEKMLDLANLSRAALSSQTGFGGLIGDLSPVHLFSKLIGKTSPLTHVPVEPVLFGCACRGFIVLIHLTDAKCASMTIGCLKGGYANAMLLDL